MVGTRCVFCVAENWESSAFCIVSVRTRCRSVANTPDDTCMINTSGAPAKVVPAVFLTYPLILLVVPAETPLTSCPMPPTRPSMGKCYRALPDFFQIHKWHNGGWTPALSCNERAVPARLPTGLGSPCKSIIHTSSTYLPSAVRSYTM